MFWLKREFENHKDFYNAYRKLLKKNKEKYPNIKVAKVKSIIGGSEKDVDWIFLIEKIKWESLLKKVVKDKLWLPDLINEKTILNDLKENNYSLYMDIVISANNLLKQRLNIDAYYWPRKTLKFINSSVDNPVVNLLRDIYKEYWYLHNDFHPWNIMEGIDWTYIIDFWNTIKPNLK